MILPPLLALELEQSQRSPYRTVGEISPSSRLTLMRKSAYLKLPALGFTQIGPGEGVLDGQSASASLELCFTRTSWVIRLDPRGGVGLREKSYGTWLIQVRELRGIKLLLPPSGFRVGGMVY